MGTFESVCSCRAIAFTNFFLQLLWSLCWIIHCSVQVTGAAAPDGSLISKSYCIKLTSVNGREKWDEDRFISLWFYFSYFLAEVVPKWQNFDWEEMWYQRTEVQKTNPVLLHVEFWFSLGNIVMQIISSTCFLILFIMKQNLAYTHPPIWRKFESESKF